MINEPNMLPEYRYFSQYTHTPQFNRSVDAYICAINHRDIDSAEPLDLLVFGSWMQIQRDWEERDERWRHPDDPDRDGNGAACDQLGVLKGVLDVDVSEKGVFVWDMPTFIF